MSCAEWIALADVIITAVLTAVIIFQTRHLNIKQQQAEKESTERQREFEEKLNQQQIELQKRQIQVDTFPYKREVYAHAFSVLELCHMLKKVANDAHLKEASPTDIKNFIDVLLGQYVPDKKQALWSMREAEYILAPNIAASIIDIRKHFDSMCSHFYVPSAVENVLNQDELAEVINLNVDEAIKDCDAIVGHTWFIETILPRELNIAGLNK